MKSNPEEHLWSLADAIRLCRRLEEKLAEREWHCSLAGSVLYRGWSDKDLDIIIYPHHDKGCHESNVVEVLENVGITGLRDYLSEAQRARYPDSKQIWIGNYETKRIDFFLMK